MADFTVHCGPQNTNYCDHCGIGDGDVPIFRINPSKTILIWICALCLQEAYGSALIEIDNLITELEKLTIELENLTLDKENLQDEIWSLSQ